MNAVAIVPNWHMAITHIERLRNDLIFVDFDADFEASLVLTQNIRNRALCANPTVPIIAMMAGATMEAVYTARDAGISEFLARPINGKAIDRVLKSVFGKDRAFIETRTYRGPDRRRRTLEVPDDRRQPLKEPAKDKA